MDGERDLDRLLASMRPTLQPGAFVFVTTDAVPDGVDPVVTVREAEGLTVVLREEEAEAAGLDHASPTAMVTLRVHSSLEAVGLTAAVAAELTAHGLSCNVVAGFFHDHLFVPHARGPEAVALLEALAARVSEG